ncbi:sigma-E processing peptidase SpoIIGA [Neomoorella humiferrea]|uniref:sigma-E processing peptidase SpoIIGA n=1 Tax=Neomoorella humiferrea TaxID=676965 RepID=UPI003D9025C7
MVYLDVLLAVNLVMDYLILWVTARLGQIAASPWRLLGGAAIGAVYSLMVLLPGGEWMHSLIFKFLCPFFMIAAAFYPLNGRRYLQALVYFYLSAFVMGGAILGAVYLIKGGTTVPAAAGLQPTVTIGYQWLFVAAAAAVIFSFLGTGWLRRNFWHQVLRLPVIITFNGRRRALKALVDTGNSLRDPLTQRPVIIVEYTALKDILPPEIIKHYSNGEEGDLEGLVKSLAGSPWAARLHLLPYQSLGQNHGMLLGFRPDDVILVTCEGMVKIKEVVVGLYRERLSQEGSYRALLHPDLLQVSMGL